MPTKTHISRHLLIGVASLAMLATATMAGPVNDFETALAGTYAQYRVALFQTNQNDKAATEQSLLQFQDKWANLMKTYRTAPPPQYADDPKWPDTVSAVDRIIAAAKVASVGGDLAKSHEILEEIRDQLGSLRSRNGVIVFSDRMNAYHEKMEQILMGKYGGFDSKGLGAVHEDAAVLSYLAAQIELHPAPGFTQDATYKEALAAMKASVEALLSAARAADRTAVQRAISMLKVPYSKLFLKYG